MGGTQSVVKINFEDMQEMTIASDVVIINTMNVSMQHCLIKSTIDASIETARLEELRQRAPHTKIVVYGVNASDESIVRKYNQLASLGFTRVMVYPGGMLEWLLLQECYGEDEFPTTQKELDILKYKGERRANRLLLTY